jgi:uncharacterized protein YjbI with pentapeptide repeats
MTQKEVAATLQQHKEWVNNLHGPGKRADLRGADLRHVSLAGADLRYADCRACDFSGADLSRADFRHADLRGANLSNSVCIGTSFVNARLDGANLRGADLRTAVLDFAQMMAVNLNGSYSKRGEENARVSEGRVQEQAKDRGMKR